MATLDFLPATTYRPPSPMQVHRRRRSLNTIMEDDEESSRGSAIEVHKDPDISYTYTKADWLSPLSDHFPTPRGHHFMSAPIPPSSSASDAESISPSPSSAPWTRDSFSTDATEFDDLYDVSSDDESQRRKSIVRRNSIRQATKKRRASVDSLASSRGSRSSLPALVIPNSQGDPWSGVAAFKLLTSPVPPTPPPKVPMSPAIFSFLQSREVPSCSAPPSLDGSLTSEQMAAMSAPATPDVENEEGRDGGHWGGGVQLQPAAMATLQALSGGDDYFEQQTEQVIELTQSPQRLSPIREMQQSLPPLITNIHRNDSIVLSPDQQRSLNSLTRLEIPSPGGFFSALSHNARHTWHLVACTPESAHPPSSTTAEHFYKTPWSSVPVERIVEVSEASETMSEGLPTARPYLHQIDTGTSTRPILQHENSNDTITGIPTALEEEIVADEIITNFESGYAEKLKCIAVTNIDRTGMWLAAQSSYLAELINPTEARDDEVALLKRAASTRSQASVDVVESQSPPRKTVRFSNMVILSGDAPCPLPKIIHTESAYYRAFQHLLARSRYRDTFVHQIPRFEAIQSQRVSFPTAHRAQLLGKYQLSVQPSSAKKRMSANVARGDETAPEDPDKFKRDKEYEALTQMAPATWNVMALKLLNGGRLLAAPVAKRLARLSSMGPKPNGRDRARILDLGGQATCDWAWYCALEYPNTKVYTVTTKSLRQLSNSNIRGPKNHRQIAVERLVKLPFRDNQFDIISAREIYTILRENGENGEDEWDSCLTECMRILKPGGYLEFSILDSDIVNAGPVGLAKSVEFGFNLKTLGFDPSPTKQWIGRLNKAGFCSVKRAWVFLPMGRKMGEKIVERDSMGVERKLSLEAMVQGSTNDVASITGVVGAWAWEKWLSRCEVLACGPGEEGEKTQEKGWNEGVSEVVEEGRLKGAGWRVMSGWARKPGKL